MQSGDRTPLGGSFAGQSVVVVGPGPVGLMSVQIAKAMGARTVILTGTRLSRLRVGSILGADAVIHTKNLPRRSSLRGGDTVGKILKLDLAELMIAANACILGPATAAAMAASQGWKDLVTPGMLTGILGYSVATFIGVVITQVLA